MKFKEIKRRGQAMVLWALLTPLLIVFVGVGMDLGWYYLTVSRLQNAADAAVLAGALNLVEQNKNKDLNDYYVSVLTTPPSDLKEYYKVSLVSENGASYIKNIETEQIAEGKAEAQTYANKNLSDTSTSGVVSDAWNGFSDEEGNEVGFSSALYAKVIDIDREEHGTPTNGLKYYEVILTEKVGHLFLRGFEPMEAKVVAYALLKPHDKDLVTDISVLEKTKVIQNWEYQNIYKNFEGNWSHFQDVTIEYTQGNNYRNETVNIHQDMKKGNRVLTDANNKANYSEMEVDVLNLDVKQDVTFDKEFSTDWDLGADAPEGTTIKDTSWNRWMANKTGDLRVHNSMNFNYAWKDRNLNDLKPDVLWTRIESDPIWSHIEGKRDSKGNLNEFQSTLNSVRQFILNVHTSNTGTTTVTDEDGKEHTVYTERPFFIFYMGPETYDANNTVRQSQPVILNLYKNWNAILYMPNSPVIINGNGYKLTGFVIAKEFVRLTEDSDYTNDGYITTHDDYGNTIFVKKSDTISEDDFNEQKKEYAEEIDAKGNITLREVTEGAPKYFIIDPRYVKGVSGISDADYIKALKKYRKVTDAEIVRITFPEEKDAFGGYNNTQSYAVVASDLLNAKPTTDADKYVAVKLTVNGTETTKYIAKTNLPYVRVYRNQNFDYYPYVPVCDLRVKTTAADKYEKVDGTHPVGYAGVTLADNDKDVYKNGQVVSGLEQYVVDDKKDTWKVDRRLIEDTTNLKNYQLLYKNGEIQKVTDDDGCRYFTLKSEEPEEAEPVATYHKVTRTNGSNSEVLYIKEDATYYVKIVPSGSTGEDAQGKTVENAVITDNKGNVQTKALPAGSTRPTNDKEQPDDLGIGKRLKTTGKNQDYRMPGWEVVYKKLPDSPRAFDLSKDSCYSYFQIKELQRVNYLYLNVNELEKEPQDRWKVDDMFFPTYRASWID